MNINKNIATKNMKGKRQEKPLCHVYSLVWSCGRRLWGSQIHCWQTLARSAAWFPVWGCTRSVQEWLCGRAKTHNTLNRPPRWPTFNYKLFHPPYLMHAPPTGWFFSCVCSTNVYCVERECTYCLTASLSSKKEVSPIDSRIWG